MRCWQCGIEPLEVYEITNFGDLANGIRTYLPGRWPPDDHQHDARPPTPGELADRGDRTMARILAIAAE